MAQQTAVEPRFIELESKVAFLEHTLETLNYVVAEQQTEIDRLKEDVRALVQHVAAIPEEGE